MDEIKIIEKEIDKSEEYGVPFKEKRYFAETNDGFDGSAQGYGYKSKQSLHKAYAYYKSRNKRKSNKDKVHSFLKNNPDIKEILELYFSEEQCFLRLKNNENSSIQDLVKSLEDQDMVLKLNNNKKLWKSIEKNMIEA